MSDYTTPRELAEELRISHRLVLEAIARRELIALRLGHRSIRIARSNADAWIASRSTPIKDSTSDR